MDMTEIHNIARQLVEAQGIKAELEATQKLKAAEEAGDTDNIEVWRRVRAAIREMKPPHES